MADDPILIEIFSAEQYPKTEILSSTLNSRTANFLQSMLRMHSLKEATLEVLSQNGGCCDDRDQLPNPTLMIYQPADRLHQVLIAKCRVSDDQNIIIVNIERHRRRWFQ